MNKKLLKTGYYAINMTKNNGAWHALPKQAYIVFNDDDSCDMYTKEGGRFYGVMLNPYERAKDTNGTTIDADGLGWVTRTHPAGEPETVTRMHYRLIEA